MHKYAVTNFIAEVLVLSSVKRNLTFNPVHAISGNIVKCTKALECTLVLLFFLLCNARKKGYKLGKPHWNEISF